MSMVSFLILRTGRSKNFRSPYRVLICKCNSKSIGKIIFVFPNPFRMITTLSQLQMATSSKWRVSFPKTRITFRSRYPRLCFEKCCKSPIHRVFPDEFSYPLQHQTQRLHFPYTYKGKQSINHKPPQIKMAAITKGFSITIKNNSTLSAINRKFAFCLPKQ